MKYAEAKTLDRSVEQFLDRLNSLDFGPLAYKLMNPEDRPGLSLEQAIDAIKKYKGFLFLYNINEGKAVSPSRYIDYVWHTHILDTELYLVQTASLFGHYLHHFPFFGKRDGADEMELLAAADFTKSQALAYFGWDDDDWCGTGRKPKWPKPHSGLVDLVNVIYPAGVNVAGINQNPDTVTIQVGNFRHTIEHFGSQPEILFASGPSLSRLDYLASILRLPIWVIVCKPVELGVLDEVVAIKSRERLVEISRSLVEKRLTPEGFAGEMVNLQLRSQAVQ
jgi:hypothetical protein